MKLIFVPIAKWVIPIGLMLLGINGLVDVQLQKDMSHKANLLKTQVTQAQDLSAQMPEGLRGLKDLQDSTVEMQAKLTGIQTATAQMAEGLGLLATTVEGLHGSITHISNGALTTKDEVKQVRQTASSLRSVLQDLANISVSMSDHLGRMMQEEASIRSNLQQINGKTAIVP